MVKTENSELIEERKRTPFNECHSYIRVSFIIAMVTSFFTILLGFTLGTVILVYFGDYRDIIAYCILSCNLTAAAIGLIFGVISFKHGKNVYNIISVIFFPLVIFAMSWFINVVNGIL